MRLFHKGILLITIPIIGQFIFVLILVGAYRTSEELAAKDLRYRTQAQELMSTSILLYKSISLLSAYGYATRDELLQAFDRNYELLVRKAELLDILDQGRSSGLVSEGREVLKKTLKGLYNIRQILALRNKSFTFTEQKALILETSNDLTASLSVMEKLTATLARTEVTDANQIERSRWIFLASIVAGFSVNMILAATLLFAYARDFANRFSVVLDNTARIPKGQELNPRIAGNDEIARLDTVFHDMDSALKEAEARRELFMSMVSHDIRSPLASVQMTIDLISAGVYGQLPQPMTQRLNSCDRLVRRLGRLVNDILDFDKIKAGKLELAFNAVTIDDAIAQVLSEMQPIAQRQSVTLTSRTSGLAVVADRERVLQVLVNLIANAIKFSPQDSAVTVWAEIAELTELTDSFAAPTSGSTSAPQARVSIQDQGPGVPEHFRTSIFLPFEQVPDHQRPKTGSTGLGLTICKMLVEMHGGTIGVDSNLPDGKGSIFWFTLPVAEVEEL